MDPYLKPGAAAMRLIAEYHQYKSIVVAYDFDNTVFDYHERGETYDDVINLLRRLKQANCYLICFTASRDLDHVRSYLTENNIPFDSINEDAPFVEHNSRKIYYNVLLDDRAGLEHTYYTLHHVLRTVQPEQSFWLEGAGLKSKQKKS